ncbi:Rid family detoxifying hydrolase [Patescibacteria group bacterium]
MEIVNSTEAPSAIGPYSQAVISNGFVFCSGQIALTNEGEMIDGEVSMQTEQVLKNLEAVLKKAGSNFTKIVKTTIYLIDINDFPSVNETYSKYFDQDHKPARATVAVKELPKGAKVEIDCIAIL